MRVHFLTPTRLALAFAGASLATAIVVGCSSSSSSPGTGTGSDAGAGGDTSVAVDGGSSGSTDAHAGDGAHDGAAPSSLYGACAVQGGFGWPCTATTTGSDPTECTDPNFPDCFVGGQGAWCTKACTAPIDCLNGANDAGCIPTDCNNRGYCK